MAELDVIEIITAEELIAYPGSGAPTTAEASVFAQLVNGLVTEVWAEPVDPIPFWVKAIALASAARASRNPKGLQSFTRSIDDGTRTERFADTAGRVGVYLDDTDVQRLRGLVPRRRRRRYGTIRVGPGF